MVNGDAYAKLRSNNSVAPARAPSAMLTSKAESMVTTDPCGDRWMCRGLHSAGL